MTNGFKKCVQGIANKLKRPPCMVDPHTKEEDKKAVTALYAIMDNTVERLEDLAGGNINA